MEGQRAMRVWRRVTRGGILLGGGMVKHELLEVVTGKEVTRGEGTSKDELEL